MCRLSKNLFVGSFRQTACEHSQTNEMSWRCNIVAEWFMAVHEETSYAQVQRNYRTNFSVVEGARGLIGR